MTYFGHIFAAEWSEMNIEFFSAILSLCWFIVTWLRAWIQKTPVLESISDYELTGHGVLSNPSECFL